MIPVFALLLLVARSASQITPNGPTGPFEPDYHVEHSQCKNRTTYCAPKHGEYPTPIRPPAWLSPYLTASQHYAGLHNDLKKLLEVRHREKWVTLFQYTLGQRDFFLNALYTYLKFGDANFYIVATVTDAAFQDCVAMQLPCYNATPHYEYIAKHVEDVFLHKEDTHHNHHSYGSLFHVQLTWMNVHMALSILELGYNFQHSDLDVGFMRRVLPSLGLLERLGADLAMLPVMRKTPHHLNPANLFALSNTRSIAFFKAYLELVGYEKDNELAINSSPQLDTKFKLCRTKDTCAQVAASGIAAMAELPTLFSKISCYSRIMDDGACSSRRLFMHPLCGQGRPWKAWSMKASGLWFLTDFSGNEVNASAGLGPTLPCAAPDDVAWHKPLEEYDVS